MPTMGGGSISGTRRLTLGGGLWPTLACNPQFDLVCGDEFPLEAVESMFQMGLLTGALIFGFISDK